MTIYPDDTEIWGPDVSFYQDDNATPGGIDFNVMKEQGASFVFIRAGQNTWEDPDFAINWAAAKDAGLMRGAYWFLDARTSGEKQGLKFGSLLFWDPGELPPVVDYEHKIRIVVPSRRRGQTMSVWKYNTPSQLDAFIAALDSPRVPIIYTGFYYWMDHGSADARYGRYPLWIAAYGAPPRVPSPRKDWTLWIDAYGAGPRVPAPWKEWTFWQFTDNGPGRVLGAESSRIDLNYFSGQNLNELNRYDETPAT